MALARAKTWAAGDVLSAADLNGEFNNILNNPISLVSPTTGAINFNLLSHTNFALQPLAVTPASATTGRIYFNTTRSQIEVDDGSLIRAVPSVQSTAITLGDIIVGTSASAFARTAVGAANTVLQSNGNTLAYSATLTGMTLASTTTLSAMTANSFLFAGAGGILTGTTAPTNGQILIAASSAAPIAANITAGANIAVTNAAGAITIASTRGTVTQSATLTPNQFTINSGSTALVLDSASPQGMSLPSGATASTILASFALPRSWSTGGITAYLHWINTSTGTGNVAWRLQIVGNQTGNPVNGVTFLDSLQTLAAAAQNTLTITNYGVTSAPSGVGTFLNVIVYRNSNSTADTLASAVKLLAVEMAYTGN